MTISPQAEIVQPLLGVTPAQMITLMQARLAAWMGVRPPRVASLRALIDRIAPGRRNTGIGPDADPFELGAARDPAEDFDPALAEAADRILGAITEPCSLSEILSGLVARPEFSQQLEPRQQALLPWVLAVTVASTYGSSDRGEPGTGPSASAEAALKVLRTGRWLAGIAAPPPTEGLYVLCGAGIKRLRSCRSASGA